MSENEIVVADHGSFLSVIERLASNPDVDVAKIEKFLDMQERIVDKNAKQAFNAAMCRAQGRMPVIPEDKTNQQTNSKYSAYETVLKHAKPIYTKEGFAVMFYEGTAARDGDVRIYADVMHCEGHTENRWVDVPLDIAGIKGNQNKTGTHAKGSSISYGRNYLIRMIFNIGTGEDDNGNAAGSKFITDEQYNELHSMFTDNGLSEQVKADFLKWAKAESIETILASHFAKVKSGLQAKINKKAADDAKNNS